MICQRKSIIVLMFSRIGIKLWPLLNKNSFSLYLLVKRNTLLYLFRRSVLVCKMILQWSCYLFIQQIASMISFYLRKNNTSCTISKLIYTVHILPEVIYTWSFEVYQKGVVDEWLEVTIYSIVCQLCSRYLDALNVTFLSEIKI